MKKIAIFQTDLGVGGIQRSLINLIKNIDTNKYAVDIFLFNKSKFYDFETPKNISIIYLPPLPYYTKFMYFNTLKKNIKKYQIEKEYDIAIDYSSYSNECSLGVYATRAKKKIMWIHNDVVQKKKEEFKYRLLYHFFKQKMHIYDGFVAVSPGIIEPFKETTKIQDKPIITIPNIIDTSEIITKSKDNVEFDLDDTKLNLISVGRICRQKGFDLLIDIIDIITKTRKDIHLYIIGDGPDRQKIEKQIDRYDLNNTITLLGNKTNPFPYMAKMDGFVLTSRYEGQGMVLLEAKALGLPLYFPKRLEKYNESLVGSDDLIEALMYAEKAASKRIDLLNEYNSNIIEKIELLFANSDD